MSDFLLQELSNITIETGKVDCDDFGDDQWNYFITVKWNGTVIWEDYFRTIPTVGTIFRMLDEAGVEDDIEYLKNGGAENE